jgi:spore germination protein
MSSNGKKLGPAKQSAYAVLLATLILHCSGQVPQKKMTDIDRQFVFHEVWGYLMKGEEKEVTGREPFTDLLYFGVTVNESGKIIGSAVRPDIHFKGANPRIHLVVFKLSDPSFLHFCFKKDQTLRNGLIDNINASSAQFDGIQIDFEMLKPDDGPPFLDFLSDLRRRMPDKILSVAVPARFMKSENDAYDYSALSGVADKIVVMAYDQHWKNSAPGPVASLTWCDSVAGYATDTIPPDKLVMGLPLYGRAWPATDLHRSLKYRQVREELKRAGIKQADRHGKDPYLEYTQSVTIKVFYEDMKSIHAKLRLYKSYGVQGVAFWRIGQGPEELWDTLFTGSR